MEQLGNQTVNQVYSSFKSSLEAQERNAEKRRERIQKTLNKYTQDKLEKEVVGKLKKNIDKKIEKVVNKRVEPNKNNGMNLSPGLSNNLNLLQKAQKESVRKSLDKLAKATALQTGGISYAASKVFNKAHDMKKNKAKDIAKDKANDKNLKKESASMDKGDSPINIKVNVNEKVKDAVFKDPKLKSLSTVIEKKKDVNKDKENNPNRSSAIISGSKGAVKKGLSLDR